MKTHRIYFIFLLSIGCIDDSDHTHSIISREPMLTVEAGMDFQDELDRIGAMSESELDAWEKSKGFVSYRTILRGAYNALEKAETDAQLRDFENRFSHVIQLKDSVWTPVVDIKLYQSIVNEYGFYQTAQSLNRLVGDFIVTAAPDKYEVLKAIDKES